jgi:uncharacterized membrane-anchored protein YhcB (DUF1043 family)
VAGKQIVVEFISLNNAAPTIEELRQGIHGIGVSAFEASQAATEGFNNTLIAFRSIGHGVQQASADFETGTLTTQGYQEALAKARREAIALRQSTGDLSSKELNAYSSVIRGTTAQTAQATVGFGRLQSSLVRVAATAAGVPGPLGQIAGQAANLAVGGPLVAGIAIGGAIIAKVLQNIGAEARKAKKDLEEATARLLKLRESARTPEQQNAEAVARVREDLARVTEQLARTEAFLAEQRSRLAAGDTGIISVEDTRNRLIREQGRLLQLINAPEQARQAKERADHEKAYAEALEGVAHQLATLRIQVDHVGKSEGALADALLREKLEREGLTAAVIDGLVVKQQEARALTQELADRQAILKLLRETRATVLEIPEPGLRGLKAPKEKPPVPGASALLEGGPLTGAETFAHQLVDSFDLSIGLVHELATSLDNLADGSLAGLEDAFGHVFDAIVSGGKVSGDQMVAGMLGAISKAARAESAFYFARGVAALAASIFPFPRPDLTVSAGQYFTAAALMGGIGLATGIGARAIGGGGARGGAESLGVGDTRRISSDSRLERGRGTIAIQGDWWPGDPRFVDKLAIAVNEMIDRGITDVRIIPAGGEPAP